MNFIGEIGSLTLPQIQEYLSGQRPFPGGQMALAAHMPALAAQAVRMKMRDGGEVPQIDKRMQALLAQRFSNGGGVYLIAYDANGTEIGLRKRSDPPFTEEASTKPAGMYRSASEAASPSRGLEAEYKQRVADRKLLTGSPSGTVGSALAAGLPSAAAPLAAAADVVTLPVRGVMGAINTALRVPNALGVSVPYIPEEAFGGSSSSLTPYYDRYSRKPDMAALNKAIDEGKMPPKTDAAKAEAEAYGKQVGVGTLFDKTPAATSPRTAMDFPTLDASRVRAALEKQITDNQGSTPEKEKAGLKALGGYDDRSADRLKGLEALRAGVEQDRELGKWMALAQFAAGMQGKRNLAAGMAGGIERGVPAFAAAQAAYRKGMSEAADKQMRIEDASDALARDLTSKSVDLSNVKQGKAVQAIQSLYSVDKDVAELAFKKLEFMQKERQIDIEAQKAASLDAYYRSGGARGAGAVRGPMGLTVKEALDKAMAELKIPGGTDPLVLGKNPQLQQQIMAAAARYYGGPLPAGGMMEDGIPQGVTVRERQVK